MFIKKITSKNAPAAIGPYSPAVKLGDFVYMSGQIPLDPKTMEVVGEDIQTQTHQVMSNIAGMLEEMGLGFRHVVKTTVFLANMDHFAAFNEVYGTYFEEPYPARSAIQVARLPKDVLVEVECMVIDTLVYEQQMMQQQGGCGGCSGSCSDGDEGCGCGGCE
ncbi:MAG: RidA family protein [Erysipelotrichaceae bacterium]